MSTIFIRQAEAWLPVDIPNEQVWFFFLVWFFFFYFLVNFLGTEKVTEQVTEKFTEKFSLVLENSGVVKSWAACTCASVSRETAVPCSPAAGPTNQGPVIVGSLKRHYPLRAERVSVVFYKADRGSTIGIPVWYSKRAGCCSFDFFFF